MLFPATRPTDQSGKNGGKFTIYIYTMYNTYIYIHIIYIYIICYDLYICADHQNISGLVWLVFLHHMPPSILRLGLASMQECSRQTDTEWRYLCIVMYRFACQLAIFSMNVGYKCHHIWDGDRNGGTGTYVYCTLISTSVWNGRTILTISLFPIPINQRYYHVVSIYFKGYLKSIIDTFGKVTGNTVVSFTWPSIKSNLLHQSSTARGTSTTPALVRW